jgi:hypothetical protein
LINQVRATPIALALISSQDDRYRGAAAGEHAEVWLTRQLRQEAEAQARRHGRALSAAVPSTMAA